MKIIGTYFYICVDKFPLVTSLILWIRHVTLIPASESHLHYLLGVPPCLCVVVYTLCYFSPHLFHHSQSLSLSPSSCRIFTHVTTPSSTLLSISPSHGTFRSLISLLRSIFHILVAFTLLFFSVFLYAYTILH